MEDRIADIEKHLRTINRELGEVIGEMTAIKWLTRGTFLAVLGKIVYDMFII
jgi:hypothetical protein